MNNLRLIVAPPPRLFGCHHLFERSLDTARDATLFQCDVLLYEWGHRTHANSMLARFYVLTCSGEIGASIRHRLFRVFIDLRCVHNGRCWVVHQPHSAERHLYMGNEQNITFGTQPTSQCYDRGLHNVTQTLSFVTPSDGCV
jgi:hypothetical protein